MLTQELRDKIEKVYELVKRGANEGERDAARKALDRILEKNKLQDIDLDRIDLQKYYFKYQSEMERWLCCTLMELLIAEGKMDNACRIFGEKTLRIELKKLDWITLECSYEYFRRHMKSQWNKICAPRVRMCRKHKTRNKTRKRLQHSFFNQYCIKSKLYREKDLVSVKIADLSQQEASDMFALRDIEGGQYKTQVSNGLYLDQANLLTQ